jgi:hypothetical protein
MMEPNCPPMARVAAAKVLLDRGWGKHEPKRFDTMPSKPSCRRGGFGRLPALIFVTAAAL